MRKKNKQDAENRGQKGRGKNPEWWSRRTLEQKLIKTLEGCQSRL